MDFNTNLTDRLKQVAVIGAAGKMGRGIALLLLQEMAKQEAQLTAHVGEGGYRLVLVDADERRLASLWDYFKPALTKYAIQNINTLRRDFASRQDLVENGEMINAFVEGAFRMVRISRELTTARGCSMVFEAVAEDFAVKKQLYQTLKPLVDDDAVFCTNTSSIPIGYLDAQAQLDHRLIGIHFYNPPPLQKLIEIIPTQNSTPELIALAQELAKRLGKTVVPSRDVAGFIGNGHFMRELCYADARVRELSSQMPYEVAVELINRMTQQLLLRPMGIFQLADYVGLDVCQGILAVMQAHIPAESFRCPLIEQLVHQGVKGGQNADGSQKSGFFEYARGAITKVYSPSRKIYESIAASAFAFPVPAESWSRLWKDPQRKEKVKLYLAELANDKSWGGQEAQRYLAQSRTIAEQLVRDGVAMRGKDVNQVLELGFSHLYGPMD